MITKRYSAWATTLIPLLASTTLAAPAARGDPKSKTCTVKSSDSKEDDTPAIHSAFEDCSNGGTVLFEHGVDYNVWTPVEATDLTDVTISVKGNLHLPKNISYVQGIVADQDLHDWFSFDGTNLNYEGTGDINNGWIYSYGQQWWDANPPGETGIDDRPHLMALDVNGCSISHFKSRKPIAWGLMINGQDVTITDTIIDAESTGGFPFNTDGIGIKARNVSIDNFSINNGDDAIAVTSGANNVRVSHGAIGYQSHGLSIGSLGSNQARFANVTDIHFDDITVSDALYASRIKTWQGGQGIAEDITWSNIFVYNVTFPIFVTQTYIDQGNAGDERPNNSSVIMKGLEWRNFTGSVNTFQPGDGSCVTDVRIQQSPCHQSHTRRMTADTQTSPAGTTSASPTCSTLKPSSSSATPTTPVLTSFWKISSSSRRV